MRHLTRSSIIAHIDSTTPSIGPIHATAPFSSHRPSVPLIDSIHEVTSEGRRKLSDEGEYIASDASSTHSLASIHTIAPPSSSHRPDLTQVTQLPNCPNSGQHTQKQAEGEYIASSAQLNQHKQNPNWYHWHGSIFPHRIHCIQHHCSGLIASTLSTRSTLSRSHDSHRICAIDSIHIVHVSSHPRYRLDPHVVHVSSHPRYRLDPHVVHVSSHPRYRLDPHVVHVSSHPRYRFDPYRLPGLIASTLST